MAGVGVGFAFGVTVGVLTGVGVGLPAGVTVGSGFTVNVGVAVVSGFWKVVGDAAGVPVSTPEGVGSGSSVAEGATASVTSCTGSLPPVISPLTVALLPFSRPLPGSGPTFLQDNKAIVASNIAEKSIIFRKMFFIRSPFAPRFLHTRLPPLLFLSVPHGDGFCKQKNRLRESVESWATRIRTLKMTESESVALPFGDSPMCVALCQQPLLYTNTSEFASVFRKIFRNRGKIFRNFLTENMTY